MTSKSPPKKCAVPFCTFKGKKGYSAFPKDGNKHATWLKLCGLSHVKPQAIICHSHFEEKCFAGEYGPFVQTRRLKKNSKPSLNLPKIVLVPKGAPDDVTIESV